MSIYVRGIRIFDGNEGDIYVRGPTTNAGTACEGGDLVPVSISSLGLGMVPTFIASGETFTVPANKQALFAETIDNEGILDVIGSLIMVD